VIIADGKAALGVIPPARTDDFGIKAHFESVDGPRDTIELFGCEGLYGGLAAIEDRRWNAAFSVPANRLRQHRGNVSTLFDQIVRENPALGRRLCGARRVSDWLAAPLPRFAVRNHWPQSIIPVGNAAAALEPIGGEGMGLALRSAELAAESLLHREVDSLLSDYRRLCRLRRPACRLAAQIISRPELSAMMHPAIQHVPSIARAAIWFMGK
jgi:2-polyprenyl-6-methoxyphenol hydroxylase-like FAD-dependent oxidoreductase